jgi:hypothetical protein
MPVRFAPPTKTRKTDAGGARSLSTELVSWGSITRFARAVAPSTPVAADSPGDEGLTAIFRVDVAISAASGLALRGFMRDRLPADFPWEGELARTMAEVSGGLARALG